MKKDILKKIYFKDSDDSNLKEFTESFLSSGLLWIYIGLNPDKQWEMIYKKLSRRKRWLFIKEYNKAFFFTHAFSELTTLFLDKKIILKNIFLPPSAETYPEVFIKPERFDVLRWKEVLELIS